MEDSFHQPKPKAYKPQGQVHFINKLAAMLQSRGAWDSLPAKEVNRSNSAPPMQFNFDHDYQEEEQFQFYQSPTMQQEFEEQTAFYAPNPVRGRMANWGRLEQPSPLRTSSAMDGQFRFDEFIPAFPKPKSAMGFRDPIAYDTNDELRMKALLNAAMDSREDLFPSPIPRAASTPPTRLLNQLEMEPPVRVKTPLAGPHTVTGSTFPVFGGFQQDIPTPRALRGVMFEEEYPARPASAQGRFVSAPPPGLEKDTSMDPAMAQALATLTASGNLTPAQVQQIEQQLRQPQQPPQQWEDKKKHHKKKSHSPTRSKNSSPTSDSSPTNRSAILEDFRTSKKKYELTDIVGSMVEFSSDQYGSRFIQQKLEHATIDEKQMVFDEIIDSAQQLITDVFGNYVIQKFFEFGSQDQREALAQLMVGRILEFALQMYGCRVVQKALEYVSPPTQNKLVQELDGHVLKCVKDQNGNHVIQKAVERIPHDQVRFIIDSFAGQVYNLATHPYGCRVLQRIFEHCNDKDTKPLLEELHKHAVNLIQDQYGNYVIQHILEKGRPKDKTAVINKIRGNVLQLSKHKFASNVVEKCVSYGNANDRKLIMEEIIQTKPDGTTPLYGMMKDQFANYVVQKLLDVSSEKQKVMLVTKMKSQLPSLKKLTYGKHLINKVEKYIQQYHIE